MEAILHSENESYTSGTHFNVYDISQTGIGLVIQKNIRKENNPMLNLSVRQSLEMQLRFEQSAQNKSILIKTSINVSRKVMSYNARSSFIGACFCRVSRFLRLSRHVSRDLLNTI